MSVVLSFGRMKKPTAKLLARLKKKSRAFGQPDLRRHSNSFLVMIWMYRYPSKESVVPGVQ
jgi:hypothetical protein